jgi:tellurite resistance protein
MSDRNTRYPRDMAQAEIIAAGLDKRDLEFLDGVVTAGALVARADGRIERAERYMLVDYLDRNGFLSRFTPIWILDAFERRLRQIEEHGGAEAAIDSLERFSGRPPAHLVNEAGRQIAIADGDLHAREIHFLQHIHIALGTPSSRTLYRFGCAE